MIVVDTGLPRTCAECWMTYESSDGAIVCCRTNETIKLDERQENCPIKGEIDARSVEALLYGQESS